MCVVVGEVEGWETVVGAYCMREESICNKNNNINNNNNRVLQETVEF